MSGRVAYQRLSPPRGSIRGAAMRSFVAGGTVLALLAAGPARAEDAPAPADVAGAIDRGSAWLKTTFSGGFVDDTWHGPTEVVVLALAHAGANLNDAVFA